MFGKSQSDIDRALEAQKTALRLDGIDSKLVHLGERVEAANHWKAAVVDQQAELKQQQHELKQQQSEIKIAVEEVANILKDAQLDTMTTEERAEVGKDAKRAVMLDTISEERSKKTARLSNIGNALTPVVSLLALVVSTAVAIYLATHPH